MRYHSYLHSYQRKSGVHKFLTEHRQSCRYCNEYKGSHFQFTYREDSLVVPYCSKKCFIEDGNTLESNEYTEFVDQWIESGGREQALELEQEKRKLRDYQLKEVEQKRKLRQQEEIANAQFNRRFRLITNGLTLVAIAGLGYYFFLYNPYSDEQMSNACDCADNSYENTQISFDNLSFSEQRKRSFCFDLFKPKDFELLKDDTKEIYDRMIDACNRSK